MASCPNCGFDLTPAGACPVCGFGQGSKAPAPDPTAAASAAADRPKSGSRRLVFVLGGLVVCLIAVAVVGAVVVSRSNRPPVADAAAQPAPVVTAPAVAADPSPAPAAPAEAPAQLSQSAPQSAGAVAVNEVQAAQTSGPSAAERASKAVDLHDPTDASLFDITKITSFPPTSDEESYVKWMVEHTSQSEKYLRERWQRAQITVQRRHITHDRILMGFLMTPREWFARSYNLPKVYENTALPIGYGQTISGPDLVARMTDYLDPGPDQKVLEIGTGSGYQSAFLSQLSNHVFTIEIVKQLAEETNAIYIAHTKEMPQLGNIHRRMADGYYGWPEFAPFDRIIVTAGIDHIPPDLLKELKPGGIMVIPIGPPTGQTILKITKEVDASGNVILTREDIYHGYAKDIFVPFTASNGGTHYLGDSGKN
jgi:protein-L-isoaspartate(D-aspartate) O-methyltransferase